MDLIRDFTDFHMLKLVPTSGVMVLGFATAYQLDGPGLDIAEHLRES
jgi:putative heme iron utilization protein